MKKGFKNSMLLIGTILLILAVYACSDDDKKNPVQPELEPIITQLSQNAAYVGSDIYISGENFGATQETGYVMFGTVKATAYPNWSDKEIRVTIPQSATSGKVYVFANNKKSNEKDLTIISAEDTTHVILTLSSDSVQTGSRLTLFGRNFGNTRGENYVTFGDVKATTYIEWLDSRIQVEVPESAVTGTVSVVKNGTHSNKIQIKINEKPQELLPVISNLNTQNAYIGDDLIINGYNFTQPGSKSVLIGSLSISNVKSWTETQITLVTPNVDNPGNLFDVSVKVGDNISNKLQVKISKKEDPNAEPIISSMDKSSFKAGETLRLSGKNFGDSRGNSFVKFNTIQATQYSSWKDTEIILTVPDGISNGNLSVVVNSKESNKMSYTVKADATIIPVVLVKAGNFTMGEDDPDAWDTYPARKVTISRDFYIGETEVTQAQWKIVMTASSNPSQVKNDNNPVEQVQFYRAAEFCNRLSQMEGLTPCYTITQASGGGHIIECDFNANGWRLPTEAEWEYAARAGSTTPYGFDGDFSQYAVTSESGATNPRNVKTKQPNNWGIYDMHGNIAEWVWDWYDASYYSNAPDTDPRGPSSGLTKVARGGSYQNGIENCSGIIRYNYPPENFYFNIGFRVVRNK